MKKFLFSSIACILCSIPVFAQNFQLPPQEKAPGEIRILCIGNSFTYVHDTDVMLSKIASSQGFDFKIG